MPAKRGRPLSTDTNNPVIIERRRQTAERVRHLRERRRIAAEAAVLATSTVTVQQTTKQSQQADIIAERPFEETDTAQTLPALGLRVQDIDLPQDVTDAQLQQDAVHVDEHDALYDQNRMTNQTSPSLSMQTEPIDFEGVPEYQDLQDPLDLHDLYDLQDPQDRTDLQDLQGLPNISFRAPFTTTTSIGNTPTSPIIISDDDDDTVDVSSTTSTSFTVPNNTGNNAESGNNSDEEISVYSFVSEHSESEHPDNEESTEISAHDFMVQKLYEQLQGGFHGCPEEQHEAQLGQHMQVIGEDDHHGLNDIFNDPSFPSVLALQDMISPNTLAQQPHPTPAQWKAMFCGVQQGHRHGRPMHVCLHKEETQAVEPQVAFDIDSFLGFASSLAMARQGLWYQPAPKMGQNMTNDVHLETNIFRDSSDPNQPPRSSLAMLRDVPHFLLGRVVGAHDITVHILFPHMVHTQDKFTCLTTNQLTRWLDQIFHPAVYQYCEAHYTQHIPASYQHALANTRARQVEQRKVETTSYQAQLTLGYHLQPEYLGLIWTNILNTISNTPGLADFREPQLFFSAKGTKLQFKTSPSRPTMLDAMENFQAYFERVVDLDFIHLNRFYVDLGKEICPSVSLLRSQPTNFDDEPQVYAWKRCCLRHYMQWMYDGQSPAITSEGQRYYEVNMLYDACDLTTVTPKRSKHRQGGLIYSQMYASLKEMSDAAKCFPFSNDGLEELALDPQIRQGAHHAAGGHNRDIQILERAYNASKHRTRCSLHDSRKKSFGIREEHRITWQLFQGLLEQLQLDNHEELEIVLVDCPSYAWVIKTDVYVQYLWRSVDKFATGFEVVRARSNQEFITWEQTKMMAMFLRCLRFVLGGQGIRRESALWWSRREPRQVEPGRHHHQPWYGLGFCNTLPQYKYCWLEPRIDWNKLTFRSDVTDGILFGNSMLRDRYLRRGGSVRDFFGMTRRLELALEWMERYHDVATIRDRLILFMVHLCLQQFRTDVLSSIKSEILDEYREEIAQGGEPFCYEYLSEITGNSLHLMSGNRCDFKRPKDLGVYLFRFDDRITRGHWENKPYRKLYRRAITALQLQQHRGEFDVVGKFKQRLQRWLFRCHWVLPYPCPEVLTQTTKQGRRMWYSIQPVGQASAIEVTKLNVDQWEWARKSWEVGKPNAQPEYVSWSKDKWIEWIEIHR